MNSSQNPDEAALGQIDRLLDQGHPHEDAFVNTLARMVPEAEGAFQEELEQMLVTRLRPLSITQPLEETPVMNLPMVSRRPRFAANTSAGWLAAMSAAAMLLLAVFYLRSASSFTAADPRSSSSIITPIELAASVVVGSQDIAAGTVITEPMIAVVSLTEADMAELRSSHPAIQFIRDASEVVGQAAISDIGWFQPIEPSMLRGTAEACAELGPACPVTTDQTMTIGLPLRAEVLDGLAIGDRVDVLASMDDQIQVVVADLRLTGAQPGFVTLTGPLWKQSLVQWLAETDASTALRLHTGSTPPERDETRIEFAFIAAEPLPEDFQFDVVVNVPIEQGYLLTNLPASIDETPFSFDGDTLRFSFKELDLVSVVRGTAVTLRLPQADADNLDYLIGLGMALSYVPDEAAASQP